MGALVATVIAAPNLLWLARHHFITLQMEHFIHLRDVRYGRAKGYFTDQFKFMMFGLPFAVGGLIALLRSPRFRLLSAFYIGPFVLLALVKGRGYYLLPAYPVLYAAGAVGLETWLASGRRLSWAGLWGGDRGGACGIGAIAGASSDMASWLRGVELADEEQRRHGE